MRYQERHFLSHTGVHLLGVLAVLFFAMMLGTFASPNSGERELAQTFSTTVAEVDRTATNASSTASLTEVMFSASVSPLVDCETGVPLTSVFLLVTEAQGGDFILSSDTGVNGAQMEWGEYPFPNGNYSWRAFVKEGYVGVGGLSGSFVVNSDCSSEAPVVESPSPAPTPITTTSVPELAAEDMVILPSPELKIFIDNKPAELGAVFDDEEIEFRVTTALAKEVKFSRFHADGESTEYGRGVKDDLLSTTGVDVWSLVKNAKNESEGKEMIFVQVLHRDGRKTESKPLSITVMHAPLMAEVPQVNSSVPLNKEIKIEEALVLPASEPSACRSEQECRAYCANSKSTAAQCGAYARFALEPESVKRSIAEEIPDERLDLLLADLSREFPPSVRTAPEFKKYCAQASSLDLCRRILLEHDLALPETIKEKAEALIAARKEERKVFEERVGARAFVDLDGDGITDYDEINIYKTDPKKVDTDQDGFPDNEELLARTNPRGGTTRAISPDATSTSIDESVRLENPLFSGETEPELLRVTDVSGTPEQKEGERKGSLVITLSGQAPSNSFVSIFIFSDPIVVTARADASGAWTYTLDKELPDGTHEIYSAITDSGGRILAKSEPFPFVKTASAVVFGSSELLPVQASAPGFFSGISLYVLIAIAVGIVGIALSIIGFMVHRRAPESGSSLR